MFVLNIVKHISSVTCAKGRKRRDHEKRQDEQERADGVKFTVKGKEIEKVEYFIYLGRLLAEDDDDTLCIEGQIKKARSRWYGIAKVLKREGANAKCMAKFYLAVVQALLLYGAESWTISKRNLKKLESFHMRAIRHMTGSHIRCVNDEWEYPNHERLLKKCGLFPIETYIERRRGTLWKYLREHRKELMEEAEGVKGHCKNVMKVLWWKQKYLEKIEMKTNFWFKA